MRQRPTNAGDGHTGAAMPAQSDEVVMWSIDGVIVPCVVRDGKAHGPVRVLENQLLQSFSSTSAANEAFANRRLLVSKYLSELEAFRLTCASGGKFGVFTNKDLVVDIDDFRELHAHVKSVLHQSTTAAAAAVSGGWVQVNNRSGHCAD